ncbi:hypothetical protein AHF37_11904, partial [Paragonimus kellicotti]
SDHILYPLLLSRSNFSRIYFATSGALCSDECGPVISPDSSQDLTLKCTTAQHATSWQYAAFAVQFCSSDCK